MKYAFYISGTSGRLYKFLLQATEEQISKISVVVSDKKIEDKLYSKLTEMGNSVYEIKYTALNGDSNKERNLNLSNEILKLLSANNVDYCFSFGSHLLSGQLLSSYRWRIINFHPSILPMYPGRKSIDQAVEHGNTMLVGNTAHFIDEGMDTGKIIMQSVIPLQSFFHSGNDYDIILDLQIEMLNKIIKLLDENKIKIYNDNVEIIGADYTKYAIFPYV